jgi:hypothetical protein
MPSRCVFALSCLLPALLACAPIQSVRAAKPAFDGAWSVLWCGDRTDPERECGGFNLYLTQEGDRLCGEHQVATEGLARLDEGQPGTVLGVVSGNKATVAIDATRSGAKYLATAERSGDRLRWRIVGMVSAGEHNEPTIIPQRATLTRDLRAHQIAHAKEVADAPCRWPEDASPK